MINTKHFQIILNNNLNNITKELETLGVYDAETDDWTENIEANTNTADQNSAADIAEEWQEKNATLTALEIEYHNTRLALRKLAENKFGLCEICSQAIEADRLEFKPIARTCKTHMNEEGQLPF